MHDQSLIIESEFQQLQALLDATLRECRAQIEDAAAAVVSCFRADGKLLICGNGGSAADSQHLAAELMSSFQFGLARPSLPAIALTTDTSILTAYSNDFDFEGCFARQLSSLAKPQDLLLAISTSGESANVIAAVNEAKRHNCAVLALSGAGPNSIASLADVSVTVPSRNTQAIQTVHQVVEHLLVHLAEVKLYPHLFERKAKHE